MVVPRHSKALCSCAHIDLLCLHICYRAFIPPSSFLRNTFVMDLRLGDRVFYTRSNGVRVPATVVGMAGDGLIHLEYHQDALRVVNRQCKMESMCT